jgi:hypothetical protein
MGKKTKTTVLKKTFDINVQAINKKIVHQESNQWQLTAVKFGRSFLIDADCIFGPLKGEFLNLMTSRSSVAMMIRASIGNNLIS